jgi:hypothetical protein
LDGDSAIVISTGKIINLSWNGSNPTGFKYVKETAYFKLLSQNYMEGVRKICPWQGFEFGLLDANHRLFC